MPRKGNIGILSLTSAPKLAVETPMAKANINANKMQNAAEGDLLIIVINFKGPA